ncbi:MAG TPA: family 16 glycoside hydrolase, partial [Pirellulales bacterium]
IIARGNHITVILNGATIVDAKIEQSESAKTLDGKPHPGLARREGHLAFLGHGARIEFRNMRVKDFPTK